MTMRRIEDEHRVEGVGWHFVVAGGLPLLQQVPVTHIRTGDTAIADDEGRRYLWECCGVGVGHGSRWWEAREVWTDELAWQPADGVIVWDVSLAGVTQARPNRGELERTRERVSEDLRTCTAHLDELEAAIDARPLGEGVDVGEVQELERLRNRQAELELELEDLLVELAQEPGTP
jgi:hypothetical protein